MKSFKFLLAIFMAGSCVVPSVKAMDNQKAHEHTQSKSQSAIDPRLYALIKQCIKTTAGICAADTLCTLIEQATGADEATQALICSAGLAGSLVAAKAIENGTQSSSLKDVAPSEVMTSYIKRKPTLAILVTLLGVIHTYADRFGVPPYAVYAFLVACKVGLLNDHKEAIGYATASSLYATALSLLWNYLPGM